MKKLCLLSLLALAACARKTDANRANFTAGLEAYLGRRGDLCLGRAIWPVDVDAHETQGRDALQMPVLEKLGLVESSRVTLDSMGMVDAKRYRLTARGRAQYLDRNTRRPTDPDGHGDFCVARIGLGQVASWEMTKEPGNGGAEIAYTYTVDAPAWTRDPDFRRVFPAVARLLDGAGHAQLKEGFTLTKDGWIANELLPAPAALAARPSQPQ
jgi:hypothetical protein